ncbi:MAG: hypothetical protein M3426_15935, partial [Actinomycetota bacterium]|nr:hypothetical protein [Actinomycetota bacterium]
MTNNANVRCGNGHSKEGKVSFEHVYNLGDSRGYFETLGSLDYRAPENGHLLFPALVRAKKHVLDGRSENGRSEEVTVVDLCCSYGINGTLLKYDVTLDDLYERYRSEELASLSSEEMADADAEFFRGRRRESAPRVVGIDVAENAVRYALRAGLIDEGFVENLEEDKPTDALGEAVAAADLLTVTGGIGYAWESTFDRLLDRMTEEGNAPWVATFPLRMVDYGPIIEVLSKYGLVTEKLSERTFPQRRFEGVDEQEYVLGELESMGIDPEGREASGCYHTEFYLSRPPEEASE